MYCTKTKCIYCKIIQWKNALYATRSECIYCKIFSLLRKIVLYGATTNCICVLQLLNDKITLYFPNLFITGRSGAEIHDITGKTLITHLHRCINELNLITIYQNIASRLQGSYSHDIYQKSLPFCDANFIYYIVAARFCKSCFISQ